MVDTVSTSFDPSAKLLQNYALKRGAVGVGGRPGLFDEKAGEQWLILLPKKWKQQQQYGWRYDPREFGAARAPSESPRGSCRA